MYPEMIADAKEEGQDRIAKYFDMVNKVEEVHANLYKKALADPSSITGRPLCLYRVRLHAGRPLRQVPHLWRRGCRFRQDRLVFCA